MNGIRAAAIHLLASIDLPAGAVNAMPISASSKPYIKLLVDPSYKRRIEAIPKKIDGFPVKVEIRGNAFTLLS